MPRKRLSESVTQYSSTAPTSIPKGSGPRRVAPGSYEGEVRKTLMELGSNDPDILLRGAEAYWKNCQTAGIDAKVCAAVIYGSERHRHEVTRTTINEGAGEASRRKEEPPFDPDTVVEGQVINLKKVNGAVLAPLIDRLVARGFDMIYEGPGDRYKVVRPVVSEGDPSAMGEAKEMAPVVSEASEMAPVVSEGPIAWRKVERNPDQAAADMKLAERFGPITDARKVYEVVGEGLAKEDSEVFLVLPLNVRGELKCGPVEVARGQRSRVTVDAADVVRAAIVSGAEGFCVVHNHPTGKCKPSDADIKLTEALKKAASAVGQGLTMVDHVVVGHGEVYSIEQRKAYKIKPGS